MQKKLTISIIFFAFLLLYTCTLAPGMTARDSGEYITAIRTLGIPHPAGAPLYVLTGRLFSYLPLGIFPRRINFMSAFFGALSVVFVFLLYRVSVSKKLEGAILSAFFFGTSLSFWLNSTRAEVYTLKFFLVIASFYVLFSTRTRKGRDLAFFLWGLSASVHTASVILFPLYFYPFHKKDILGFFRSLPFFFLGLTPYLYLPIRSVFHPLLSWGEPHTLRGFWEYISASRYGGELFKISPSLFFIHNKQFFLHLREEFFPVILLFSLPGFFLLLVSNNRKKLFFIFLFFTDFIFFNALPSVISHMFLFSYAVISISAAYEIERILREKKTSILIISLFLLSSLSYSYRRADRSRDTLMYHYGKKILSVLPCNSVLVNGPMDTIFLFWYLEWTEGFRKDVLPVNFNTFYQPFFLKQIKLQAPHLHLPEVKKFLSKTQNPCILSRLTLEEFVKLNPQVPIFFNFYPQSLSCPLYNRGVIYTVKENFPLTLHPEKFLQDIGWQEKFYIDEEERLILSQVFFYQALYYKDREERDRVKRNLLQTIKLYPYHHLALHLIGKVLEEENMVKPAESFYISSLEAEPSYTQAYLSLLSLYWKERKWESLQKYSIKTLHIFPGEPLPYLYLGLYEIQKGNRRKAEKIFTNGLKRNPHFLPLLYNLALVKIELGKKEEAKEFIQKGLLISPRNTRFLFLKEKLNSLP